MTNTIVQTPPVRVASRTTTGGLLAWGLLHVVGGVAMIAAASAGAQEAIESFATGLATTDVSGPAGDAIAGVVGFHGFNIAAAGAAVTGLAWRGRHHAARAWLPLTVATIADIGLVAFLLAPGTMRWIDGSPGLVLLAIAAAGVVANRARSQTP